MLKKIVFKIFCLSGIPFLIRNSLQRNKVTIVLFHELKAKDAGRVFNFLMSKYNVISLQFYLKAMLNKDYSRIPKKALIITFDDGHVSNYQLLPTIKSMSLPVTVFLCASIVGTNRKYWFKHRISDVSIDSLKRMSNEKRIEFLKLNDFSFEREFETPQSLQEFHINEMKSHVDFQAHTKFHPILPTCKFDEAKEEILGSKIVLENRFGLCVNSFAFPNGDYSERDIALVKNSGFHCALTVDLGFNDRFSDLFRLKRISLGDSDNLDEISVKASGLWMFLKQNFSKSVNHGIKTTINENVKSN
jgi:peptidoglycan/xylan/chitin deacetylase (PgdA/CDA1 family)